MQERSSANLAEDDRETLLASRVRAGLWVFLLAIGAYSIADLLLLHDGEPERGLFRTALAVAIVGGLFVLRWRSAYRWSAGVALTIMALACVSTAAGSSASGDTATTALVAVVLVTVSASLLPWGLRAHALLVLVTIGSTLGNVLAVHGGIPVSYIYPAGAMLSVWVGSFYVVREVQRTRRRTLREAYERRRAEETARHRQAQLAHVTRLSTMGEIAAELAHELNQPLGAIVSYARGCQRRLQSGALPSELMDALEQIAAQAVRASEIIRRLRSLVRKGEPHRQPTDMNELVRSAVRFATADDISHPVTLSLALSPSLPAVRVDPIQIEQVLINLIRNGIEAMRESNVRSPTVLIETRVENGGVIVNVLDNGPGLPPGAAERVFEPFFTTKKDGLGMGLPISKSIVEAHDGRLWFSPRPTGGCAFHVFLPAQGSDGN